MRTPRQRPGHATTQTKASQAHRQGTMQQQASSARPTSMPHLMQLQRSLGNRAVTQMMESEQTAQLKDDAFYPSADKEPHIHQHKGGITYTAVGHRHKTLQDGDQIRESAIMETYEDLQLLGSQRAQDIMNWIQNHFGINPPLANQDESDKQDENLPQDWVDSETSDHNPEGTPPPGFSFGSFKAKNS